MNCIAFDSHGCYNCITFMRWRQPERIYVIHPISTWYICCMFVCIVYFRRWLVWIFSFFFIFAFPIRVLILKWTFFNEKLQNNQFECDLKRILLPLLCESLAFPLHFTSTSQKTASIARIIKTQNASPLRYYSAFWYTVFVFIFFLIIELN